MWQPYDADNIYEGEVRYENNQVVVGNTPRPPPRGPSLTHDEHERQQKRAVAQDRPTTTTTTNDAEKNLHSPPNMKKWIIIGIVLAAIIILLLVGVFIQNSVGVEKNTTGKDGQVDSYGSWTSNLTAALNNLVNNMRTSPVKSCRELKMLGLKTDGIYYIKPEDMYPKTEVFCDMTTNGGGWTLVASVHDADIRQKCGVNDLWSKYIPKDEVSYGDKTNWEVGNDFGDLYKCTVGDYKNSAYHTLSASDVMIWHVDSGSSLLLMKENSRLRYRTSNRFLQRFGGNLKNVFEKRYPVKVKSAESPSEKVVTALVENAARMRSQIPDWYDYTYGNHAYRILDGNMYSAYGNQILSSVVGRLYYEREYQSSQSYSISSSKSKPFVLVNVISNEAGSTSSYYTQVDSRRSKEDAFTSLQNNITSRNYKLQYHALQYSSSDNPTPCEFHFVVTSRLNWGSAEPTSFKRTYKNNPSTARINRYQIDGYPSNVVMGYVLLARNAGKNVTEEQADKVASIILESIMSVSELFNGNRAEKVINALTSRSAEIRAKLPDWFDYTYRRSSSSAIYDDRMYYSYGNQVILRSSQKNFGGIIYGRNYVWEKSRSLTKSRTAHPFTLATVISNEDRVTQYYYTEVQSRRNNTEGDIVSQLQNNVTKGNYKLQYNLIQFSYPSLPTPCEFHFVVSNVKDWRSVEPSSFKRTYSHYGSINRYNRFQVDGSPSNIVMGYILLTRQNGNNVTAYQADSVARIILDSIASVHDLFKEYPGDDALVVPITFDKGSNEEVLNMIPPDHRRHVEPGYLQFRAYNFDGYPNAFCPGVKVKSVTPEYTCIGGLSNDVTEYGTCGDFAGWGGNLNDVIAQSSANGSAHSQQDISSAILIFYR